MTLIKSAMELLELKIKYPDSFSKPNPPTFESDLYLKTDTKDFGILGMTAFIISLHNSKQIFQRNGLPADLIQISRGLEKLFNFEFGNIYKKEETIFKRTNFKPTKELDFLCDNLKQECKKRAKSKKENEKKMNL